MQLAVEYQLRGLLRLYLFQAENEEEAKQTHNHHSRRIFFLPIPHTP
jgi:hypothetical protein